MCVPEHHAGLGLVLKPDLIGNLNLDPVAAVQVPPRLCYVVLAMNLAVYAAGVGIALTQVCLPGYSEVVGTASIGSQNTVACRSCQLLSALDSS